MSTTLQDLAFKIADDAARITIDSFAAPPLGRLSWRDTSAASALQKPFLDEAIDYLTRRGLLVRSLGNPNHVRLETQAWRMSAEAKTYGNVE